MGILTLTVLIQLFLIGFSEDELLGKSIDTLFNEVPDDIFKEEHTDSNRTYTGELTGENENTIPVSISRGKISGKDTTVEGYVFVASDISSQKKAQQKISESLREKEVLLAEIHHRVKNNLAVISGLLQMQMWESENKNAKSALQQSHLRVQSIALVHEKLYQSESLSYIQFDRYLQDLLQTIADIYISGKSDIDINSNLNELTLNVNQAIPCALLINELVINAFKYAFEDTDEGMINVEVQKDEQQVLVRVSDNGRGFAESDKLNDGPSLGLTLVDTLAEQLNGNLL